MKTWAPLAAAAALTIGAAAHAAEPLKLDNAALDSVTAGSFFLVEAFTFGAQASFGSNVAIGGGSTSESAYAFGERKVTPSGETLKLYGLASGRSTAAGPTGFAQASGGAQVSLVVFNNGIINGSSQ